MAAVILRNLLGPTWDVENIGGLAQQIFVAEKRWFSSIKKPKDLDDNTATEPEDFVEIRTAHTFLPGYGFIEIYNTRDAGEIKLEGVGERDGRASKGGLKVFYPGLEARALGQFRMIKNMQLIVIAIMATGKRVQAGSELFPAEAKFNWDGAKNESGVRGSMLEIDFFGPGAQLYLSTIPLMPSSS